MDNITRFLKLAALAASLLLLSSCGSGGGGGSGNTGDVSTSTSTQISGIASKGPVINGTVTAYSIVSGLKGVVLASKTSDSSGKYTLDLGVYTGPVLIEVTGGTYKDEATGSTVALVSTLRSAIANVVPNKSGSTLIVSASITPLTEAAVKNAVAAGGLTVTSIQTANDDVRTQVGFDPVSTQPADATNLASATASVAAKAYAVLLGTVSQYLKDNPSKSLENATSDFAIAYKAGGGGPAGNPLIAAAGNSFGANTTNQTGVSNMAALQALTASLATIDDEDPVSQRTVAAALFKDDASISACGPNSVAEYQSNTCSVMYNHNLSGMPGCFNVDYSNYIGHYQKNDTGIDWKTPGFSCVLSSYDNIYKNFVWSTKDGRVMDGTHNGIDFVRKHTNPTNPKFYAITPGVVISAGTDSYHTIAIYDATKNLTTLYLHASSVNPALAQGVTINAGDFLGYQGNIGLTDKNGKQLQPGTSDHVHISVRAGKNFCACSSDPVNSKGGYLPPIATLLTYVDPPSAATPIVSGVNPTSMEASTTSQSLVIAGSNFSSGSVVQFKWSQGSGANVWTNASGTTTVNTTGPITVSMIPGPVADTIYVRVCSNNGLSNCSDGTKYVAVTVATVPALTIAAPTSVSATAGNGQATISWNAVTGAISYNLYMASITGVTKSNYSSLIGGVKVTGVTSPAVQASLTNGTTYYFVVTVVDTNGESSESSQVSATPQASSVPPYTITEYSTGISTGTGAQLSSFTAGSDGNFWFTYIPGNGLANPHIERFTTAGVVTDFSAGISAGAVPSTLTAGPDGNLWFGETYAARSAVGRITPAGVVTEFVFDLSKYGYVGAMTAGPDGNLWYTTNWAVIGRITPAGVVTEFSTGISADALANSITAGPDGNLWFTETRGNRIGRITPAGVVTEFSTGISADAGLSGITAGPDGNLWFTEFGTNRIGRITPTGVVTEFSTGISAGAGLFGITAGPDGNLWFTEMQGKRIGRITPDGVVTEFSTGISTGAFPGLITAGPDGNIWFTESGVNRIGRITLK